MSVAAVRGFGVAGLHCGVKVDGVPDLVLSVAVDRASVVAVFAAFTTVAPVVEMGRASFGRVVRCVNPVRGFLEAVERSFVGWLP